jgi:oligopeptide transport system ATP-binding protein
MASTFKIERGETLGLVGESGCGKSTLARTLIRLYPADLGPDAVRGHRYRRLCRCADALTLPGKAHADDLPGPLCLAQRRMTVRDLIAEPLDIAKYRHPDAECVRHGSMSCSNGSG